MSNGRLSEVTREEFLALQQQVEECLQTLDLQSRRIAQMHAELQHIRLESADPHPAGEHTPGPVDHQRPLSYWTNLHDNEWVTYVNERQDGSFVAWAAPVGEDPVTTPYIEDSEEHAKLAAEFMLRTHSGHAECSSKCSGWRFGEPISDITRE